jgi:hypothetical protein
MAVSAEHSSLPSLAVAAHGTLSPEGAREVGVTPKSELKSAHRQDDGEPERDAEAYGEQYCLDRRTGRFAIVREVAIGVRPSMASSRTMERDFGSRIATPKF